MTTTKLEDYMNHLNEKLVRELKKRIQEVEEMRRRLAARKDCQLEFSWEEPRAEVSA